MHACMNTPCNTCVMITMRHSYKLPCLSTDFASNLDIGHLFPQYFSDKIFIKELIVAIIY